MNSEPNHQPQRLARFLESCQNTIFYNLGGGPKIMPLRYQVNFFKGGTFFWILILMYFTNNYSSQMLLYLAIHGSYGFFWLLKDNFFPDYRSLKTATIGSHFALLVLLSAYWLIPLPMVLGYGVKNPSILRMISIIVMYLIGLTLMMGSDYQKWHTLKRQKGLINTGFFKYSRNPNYLGEFLIYTSFCLCSGHVLGFLIFYLLGGLLFTLNIYLKQELSFKLKVGYQQYARQSNIFLIKIFNNNTLDWLAYLLILTFLINFYSKQSSSTFFYPFDQFISNL